MLQIGHKSEKQWRNNLPTQRHRQIFWRFVSLVTFSYWSIFHVNITAGSGVMTIFFYQGLTRNPEIRKAHIWVLPNIWRLGRVRDTKFGTNVSNKRLQNPTICRGYSFHCFWVIKGKPTEGGGGGIILPPRLRLRRKKWATGNESRVWTLNLLILTFSPFDIIFYLLNLI